MAMHDDRVADFFLRRAAEVVPAPYRHEGYARMWLWWAATTNLFLGVVMVRAARWPVDILREVTLGAVGVYAIGHHSDTARHPAGVHTPSRASTAREGVGGGC